MIRIGLSREPEWHDLDAGVRVRALPVTTAIVRQARREAAEQDASEDLYTRFLKAVARQVVVDWEGVADAWGDAAEVAGPAIDALMDLVRLADAFEAKVVHPAFALEREKNGFAPSPNGTSAGARDIARPARPAAPSAPSGKTRPKPAKGGTPGT